MDFLNLESLVVSLKSDYIVSSWFMLTKKFGLDVLLKNILSADT